MSIFQQNAKPLDVTVTFLEMNAPPAHSVPLPLNRQVVLLRTKKIPLHFYRYLADRVGRQWNWVNILRLSDEELRGSIHAADREISVLYLDGAPVGFIDLRLKLPGEVELAYFGMMEHVTGQGLGRWFLSAAIDAAWSHAPGKVTVQTCTADHPAALPLYQKMGFSPFAQQQESITPMSFHERADAVMRD